MQFKLFNFPSQLLNLIEEAGFEKTYAIQEKVIPLILQKSDVLGIAKTGSGKTASYVLPLISMFRKKVDSKNRHISILVVVPTRELAIQVADVFIMFKNGTLEDIRVKSVYGGVSINPQMKAMRGVDILVATPGRLLDLVESSAVHLSSVQTLILDEADKMLSLGFEEEMNKIFKLLPKKRQNLLFSATLSEDITDISNLVLNNPKVINVKNEEPEVESTILQTAYFVSEEKKGPLLRYLIKEKNMERVLVFTSSKYQTNNIANKLYKNGIQCATFHSKKSQSARNSALKQFKEGKIKVLIATDLLSRGIDIEKLPYVINYELPRSPKDFIHRIGRTGRAESFGEAISFVTPQDEHHFKIIQKKMGTWPELIDSEKIDLKGY